MKLSATTGALLVLGSAALAVGAFQLAGIRAGGSNGGSGASSQQNLIPSYATQVKEFQRELVFEMKTADGKAVGNGMVEFVQPTVLGYVKAKHRSVQKFTTQRVFEQRFLVDGKEIPYLENPSRASQGSAYWTLKPDIKVGYDVTHIFVKPSNPASSTMKVVGLYKGYTFTPPRWDTGSVSAEAATELSTKLSAQEKKLFSMPEIGPDKDYTHEEVRAILSGHGMLRKSGEKTVAYVKRFQKWAMSRFRYDEANGTERHVQFIRSGGAANCNPLAAAYELCLRSQGVSTRIVSGICSADGSDGHSFTQFFDEVSGTWLSFIAVGATDSQIAYGDYRPDVFVFQPYSRYWYQSMMLKDDGIESGNQLGYMYGFTTTNSEGVLDPLRGFYNMQNTWIRDVQSR